MVWSSLISLVIHLSLLVLVGTNYGESQCSSVVLGDNTFSAPYNITPIGGLVAIGLQVTDTSISLYPSGLYLSFTPSADGTVIGAMAYFSNVGGSLAFTAPDVLQGAWSITNSVYTSGQLFEPGLGINPPWLGQGLWWLVFNISSNLQWNTQTSPSTQNPSNYIQIVEWKASPTGSLSSWTNIPAGLPYLQIRGCVSPLSSPSPTASTSSSPSPTASTSSSPSPTASTSSSPSPTASISSSPSPTASASGTPSPSYTPFPTPSALPTMSPSPSGAPSVVPITLNVTANFGQDQPTLDLSAVSSSSSSGAPAVVGLRSELSQVQSGNSTFSGISWSVASGGSNGVANSSVLYSCQLDNATSLEQVTTFHQEAVQGNFSGLTFAVGASTVKWSLNITSTSNTSSPSGSGFTIGYQLSSLNSSTSSLDGSRQNASITEIKGHPQANMTTYLLSLSAQSASSSSSSSSVVGEVQVFDVALIDGSFVPINHSVIFINNTNNTSGSGGYYELVLTFPPFEKSLFYDPSLGLGVLVGSNGGNGGGSDNTALVIAVAVVVPVAVIVVVSVVLAGTVVIWLRRRRQRLGPGPGYAVNFDTEADVSAL